MIPGQTTPPPDSNVGLAAAGSSLGRCAGCRQELGWPPPEPGYWAAAVSCGSCGRWIYTEADEILAPHHVTPTLSSGFRQTARGLSQQFSPRELSGVVESLRKPLARVAEAAADPVLLPAVPLDASLRVATSTIEARLQELTTEGCRLQIDASLKVGFLLIDFSRVGFPGLQALAAVRQVRLERNAMHIGCQFLAGDQNPPGDQIPTDE